MLKIQEAPDLVPTGEMPRSFVLTSDRYLVDKVSPGMRVTVVGVFSIVTRREVNASQKGQANQAVRSSYLRVVGMQTAEGAAASGSALPQLTSEDEDRILNLAKDPEIYAKISRSVGGAIYGVEDVKKAISCMLFGGSSKRLPDGMKLRGDINVLLLGDPSTAKSQMLKFVEKAAPISVYTSGKGSSAAGLTAAVIKDASTGEF